MSRRNGFTLVEALVALAVLSLGLLAIAGLQLAGVRNTQNSYFRSQATIAMNDLAERIYANLPAARQGQYGSLDSRNIDCAKPPAAICVRETAASAPPVCTSAQMASYDSFAVSCGMPQADGKRGGGVVGLLPGGRVQAGCTDAAGTSFKTCTPGAMMRIVVTWNERLSKGEGGALVPQSVEMMVQP